MLYVKNPGVGRLPRMNALKYHFGLQLRCYPSDVQKKLIDFNGNNDRFLYNRDVAIQRAKRMLQLLQLEAKWKQPGKLPFDDRYRFMYFDVIRYLPFRFDFIAMKSFDATIKDSKLKEQYTWFDDPMADSLVPKNVHMKFRSALHMMKAVNHHWPNFHKKSYRLTYQTSCSYTGKQGTNLYTGSVRFLDTNHLWVPKLGRIRVAGSQGRMLDLNDKQLIRVGTVTICHRSDDKFTISLQLGSNQPFVNVERQLKHRVEDFDVLGIDLNTENFLTDSTGHCEPNPRFYQKSLKKLKRLQRAVSRKQRRAKKSGKKLKNAKNYQRNRIRLAKLQQHIKDSRKNFANQLSYAIIKNHDFVVTERLQSKNLLRNHALAQSIGDVGWRQFIADLNYKAALYNKISLQVNPRYTTQMCQNCSFRMGTVGTKKLQLKDREWTCPCCGKYHVRDHNAALNILARGFNDYLASQSMGKQLREAKKQYLQHRYHLASKMLGLPCRQPVGK